MIFYYCYWLLTLPLYIYIHIYLVITVSYDDRCDDDDDDDDDNDYNYDHHTNERERESKRERERERERERKGERKGKSVCVGMLIKCRECCVEKNNQFLPEEDRRVYRSRAQPSIAGEEQRYPSSSNVLSPRVHGSLIVSRCRLTRATRGS